VSGRPTRGRNQREKQFSFRFVPRVRNGGRHPDLRENGTLRGVSGERRSRLVRYVGAGVLPLDRTHQRQTGARGSPRRGTLSACALRTQPGTVGSNRHRVLGTRPSLGPSARACPSSRSLHGVKKPREGGASGNASTARNPAQAGETDGGATSTGRARLATRSPPSSGGSAWPGETEEGCGLRPARKMQLRVVLVRRNAVAEVVGRCLTSNKPAVRTLKRVADASERGSSAESESAHMRRRRSRVKKHRESVRGGHRLRVRPGPRVV
jgi:hypothetical protein